MKRFFLSIAFATVLFTPLFAKADFMQDIDVLTFGSGPSSLGLPGKNSTDNISSFLVFIVGWLLFIMGFLAVIGFVIAGIMYIISAGDEDMAERAKSAMLYSAVGVIVGLLGYVVLITVDGLLKSAI